MIVHARDSMLRVVDLETETVVHWLRGVLNNRYLYLRVFYVITYYNYALEFIQNVLYHLAEIL